MLPFSIALRAGDPIYEQVIYAVTKAVVSGQLRPGDAFPSVRVLSQELKINPNTAHKIVAALTSDGLLAVVPGIGTVVAPNRPVTATRQAAFEREAERLVVDAKRAGLSLNELLATIRRQWLRTAGSSAHKAAR
jgi:GntR family transcriptional regulator